MKEVKHHHQTVLPDDPIKDISANVWNENHDINIDLNELNEDVDHRTVSDIEKSTWNSKQDALSMSTINADIDFSAESSKDVTIPISGFFKHILRGRLWIDVDPGAFSQWMILTFYNKADMKGEDAFYRTSAKLVYTELEVATTGSDANITPDDHVDFSPNDLIMFLDDDEKVRLKTIADTMIAEENVGAHSIDVGISRIIEFSGFTLFNNESESDVYCKIEFINSQTISLKMELIVLGG